MSGGAAAPINFVAATAARIPTETPEEDGTLSWDATTIIIIEISAGGEVGLGYTYAHAAALDLIGDALAPKLIAEDAIDIPARWTALVGAVRNIGRPGLAACAISATDVALWDLKAKLYAAPLHRLLGAVAESAEIYGSGGFTNMPSDALASQLRSFEEKEGCSQVKMKVGARPAEDQGRIDAALSALSRARLMVDANGAFAAFEGAGVAQEYAERSRRSSSTVFSMRGFWARPLAGLQASRRRLKYRALRQRRSAPAPGFHSASMENACSCGRTLLTITFSRKWAWPPPAYWRRSAAALSFPRKGCVAAARFMTGGSSMRRVSSGAGHSLLLTMKSDEARRSSCLSPLAIRRSSWS